MFVPTWFVKYFSENQVPFERSSPLREHFFLAAIDVCQVEEAKTPLEAALSVVRAYADAWGSDGFPVPAEDEVASQAGDGAVGAAASSVQGAPPPKPLLLHRAVWAQAGVLTTRCQLLSRVGETLSAEIRKKADLVRKKRYNLRQSDQGNIGSRRTEVEIRGSLGSGIKLSEQLTNEDQSRVLHFGWCCLYHTRYYRYRQVQ